MPWDSDTFKKHNKEATGKAGELGAKVANQVLEKTGDEGRAIREANAVIGRYRSHVEKKKNG